MSVLIFIVSIAAMIVALKVLRDSKPRPGQPTAAERIASLEERVRDLLFRVWTLEQQTGEQQTGEQQTREQQAGGQPVVTDAAAPPEPHVPPAPEPIAPAVAAPPATEAEPALSPAWSVTEAAARRAAVEAAAPTSPAEPMAATA